MHGQISHGTGYPYHYHKRTSPGDRKSARSFPISLGGERLERASQVGRLIYSSGASPSPWFEVIS
jgi:hypothetical protein